MIGCGGLIAVVVVLGVILAAAGGGGGAGESTSTTASPPGTAAVRANEGALEDGGMATAEGLKITIVQIIDPYSSPNQFSRPAAGTRFVAFKVLFENVGNRSASVSAFNFKLIDADNFQHNFESIVFDEPSLVGQGQQLGGAAKIEGWIGFEVKEGVGLRELTYDPNPVTTTDHHFRVP
jgi:hypothetical protein